MAEDSTIEDLDAMTTPAGGDLVPCADVSEAHQVKKLELDQIMGFVTGNNGAFQVNEDGLKLLKSLDCNQKKLKGLAPGSETDEAVNYGQIKAAIQSLAGLTASVPIVTDKGAFIRVQVNTIHDPWGGFYLFYWCVDDNPATVISVAGGIIQASSGAYVNFDGSVANVVNLIKDEAGWRNKYIHVAVMYRNLLNLSNLSGTGHRRIETDSFVDLVGTDSPEAVANVALVVDENVAYINGDKVTAVAGQMFRCEILLDDYDDTQITGMENGLVSVISLEPRFIYPIPLTKSGKSYIHARIATVSLSREESFSTTKTMMYNASEYGLTNAMMEYIADRMKEKLATKSGDGLERI